MNTEVLNFDPGPDRSRHGYSLAEAVTLSPVKRFYWAVYYYLQHHQKDPLAAAAARARQFAKELPDGQRQRVLADVESVIEEAADLALTPDRVARDPEGGVVFYFWGAETMAGGAHRKYAMFECSAEDGMFVTVDDRLHPAPSVWEVTGQEEHVRASLERIRDFIAK